MTQSDIYETLDEATRRLAAAFQPEKIYLFGSYAWGVPTPDSDIDLLVIVKVSDYPPYRRSREAYRALRGVKKPFEVLVRTVDEIERSKKVVSSLARKVLDQGKLLYG